MNEDHPVEATNDHDVRDMRRSINDYFDEIKRRKKERSLRNCIKRFRYAFREAKALRAPQIDEREILTFLMGRNVDELNFIIKLLLIILT